MDHMQEVGMSRRLNGILKGLVYRERFGHWGGVSWEKMKIEEGEVRYHLFLLRFDS